MKNFANKLHMRLPNRLHILLIPMLCLTTFSITSHYGYANVQAQEEGNDDIVSVSKFNYELEGRPDPFEPFIKPQVATQQLNPDEIIDDGIPLSGMQLFEPGQLQLVAILFTDKKKIAMVQDVTGAGYILDEGILIGRHGQVSQINRDEVVITETAKTRSGKEVVSTVVMRLNKEGDQ